jgi:hypothetical protein
VTLSTRSGTTLFPPDRLDAVIVGRRLGNVMATFLVQLERHATCPGSGEGNISYAAPISGATGESMHQGPANSLRIASIWRRPQMRRQDQTVATGLTRCDARASRFLDAMCARSEKFALSLHPDKTRIIRAPQARHSAKPVLVSPERAGPLQDICERHASILRSVSVQCEPESVV